MHYFDYICNAIKNNKNREPKELKSNKTGAVTDVMVKECYYYEDEVRYVTDEILSLLRKGYKTSEIAVLYRNSALSRNFELSLIENKVPYRIFGGFSYLKRKEIKDIMSYFRFIIDETKLVHFKRILNLPPRGIGDKTIERIAANPLGKCSFLFKNSIGFFTILYTIYAIKNGK